MSERISVRTSKRSSEADQASVDTDDGAPFPVDAGMHALPTEYTLHTRYDEPQPADNDKLSQDVEARDVPSSLPAGNDKLSQDVKARDVPSSLFASEAQDDGMGSTLLRQLSYRVTAASQELSARLSFSAQVVEGTAASSKDALGSAEVEPALEA